MIKQKLDGNPEVLIPVSDVPRSIVILGNANNLVSETRREAALEKIQPSLRKYAKGDFSDTQSELFVIKVKENLVQRLNQILLSARW